MGSPSTQNEIVYQTAAAEVTIQGLSFKTTQKFSSEFIAQSHLIPKEMAIATLKSLVGKLEEELANGNMN